MRFDYRRFATIGLAGAALFAQITYAQQPAQQPTQQAAPGRGRGPIRPPDPRVQQLKYHFADTNEDLPYALYVSSRVTKSRPAPLIVALHGVGGDHNSLLRGNAIDLAEEGGYIMVGPMGYTTPADGTARRWAPRAPAQPGGRPIRKRRSIRRISAN
jgi:poly(3-hydroxybutyrate) depolymerase